MADVKASDPRCPHCGGALRDQDGWTGFDNDSTGPFVMCRHCQRRVKMEEIPTPQGGPRVFYGFSLIGPVPAGAVPLYANR